MLFIFVDNTLALSHKAKDVTEEISNFYNAKDGSVKPPNNYLGLHVLKAQLGNGCEVWATSPMDYVKNALAVVEHVLNEAGKGFSPKNKVKNPFPSIIGRNLM